MALSDKTNHLVKSYIRRQHPEFEDGLRRYITDELQRIEQSIGTRASAAITVAEAPTDKPVKGMVRYAVSP